MKKSSFVSRLVAPTSLLAAVATASAGSLAAPHARARAASAAPVTVTYYAGGQTLTPDYRAVLQAVEDKFYKDRGVRLTLNMVTSSYDTTVQKVNTLIAAGQLDMVISTWTALQQGGWLAQPNLFMPLGGLLKSDGPHVRAWLPPALQARATVNGQQLGLVVPSITNAWVVFWIRRDLVKKAGLAMPRTLNDLERTLLKFKAMGVRYPMSSSQFPWLVGTFWGAMLPNPYLGPNGQLPAQACTDYEFCFFPGRGSDRTKLVLTMLHRWYTEGLFSPAALTGAGDTQLAAEEASGKVAAASDGAWLHSTFDQANAQRGYDWTISDLYDDRGLPTWPGYAKGSPYEVPDRFQGILTAAKAKAPAIMRFIDWLSADPANLRLATFGIEGRDYKMVGGKVQQINGSNGKPLYGGEVSDFFNTPFAVERQRLTTTDTHGGQVWLKVLNPKTYPVVAQPDSIVSYVFKPQVQTKITDLTTYADSEFQKLILGQEPISNLPQIYARFKGLGLDQVMAEKQRQFDAARKAQGQG